MDTPIVTLTTDWGDRDFFVGKAKGRLYSDIPGVRVVDITHNIDPFSVKKAAFVVKNACAGFPAGTVHIVDVNSSSSPNVPFVAVEHRGQYYVCSDNGVLSDLVEREPVRAVRVNVPEDLPCQTFVAAELFCMVAAKLVQGVSFDEIGTPHELNRMTPHMVDMSSDRIKVRVAYVDNYGNADLNMMYEEFERLRRGRPFCVMVREESLRQVCRNYAEVRRGQLLLTVSSTGYLQVAVREGSADQLFGLSNAPSDIIIVFK